MESASDAEAKPGRLELLRRKYPWLDRLIRAGVRYQEQYGDFYAAAITYFSVLALVPLLMIAFAAAGFVLAGNPALLGELRAAITQAVPDPALGGMLNAVVDQAIGSAGTVGAIGLLVALYSGLGWMTSLRDALSAQWSQQPPEQSMLRRFVADLLSLIGLGLALGISFGLSAVVGGAGRWALAAMGLGNTPAAGIVLQVLAVALSLVASWLVFLWVLSRLPRQPVTLRSAVWGALFAAVGFEVLKQVGVIYLESVTRSPSGAAFGPILGLMVFAYLTSRFILFVTAWTASSRDNLALVPPSPPGPAIIRPVVQLRSSRGVTASSFGLGAVAGWLLRRR